MTLVHTLAVAEYLNFRHAANALGVAQSSVSARVKALEEDLGMALLRKSRVCRGSPFPGQTYPTASVTGMPSAV
nr:LysR family transcriptional regulator [Pseudogemmobacter faecipullorum]